MSWKGLYNEQIWTKYISKMNIKETLLFLMEGIAFLLCLAAIYFFVIVGCAMVDSCYYYYFPEGSLMGDSGRKTSYKEKN